MKMIPRATSVQYKKGYSLLVVFTSGEEKIFDLRPYLSYPVYEPLKDEAYCARAKVKNGIVIWDEELDLDPDRLYMESVPVSVAS
jgi:hypothetical protein